jgi:hypothetical protein
MHLPNHFLADSPELPVTPEILVETCRNLRRNRERYLATQKTETLIALLCEVAGEWRRQENKFRKLALTDGPAATGFSRATIERGLDALFAQFTPENFRALLVQEFGDAARLDKFTRADGDAKSAMVITPELLVHVCAGNLPNPAIMSLTFGVLLRSAQFVKCASGASFLPRLFAHSLHEADPHLGRCFEIAEWRGGEAALEEYIFAEADCVTATGGDEALAAIRARVPVAKKFVSYGHRLSFGFISSEQLTEADAPQLAVRAADDVTAWDQQGCLSPHVFYIEDKGAVSAEKLAELLAAELHRRETTEPRGEISLTEAATIATRREIYEIRAASAPEATRIWHSADSTAWTVVFESEPRFQASCLNRFVYVKSVGAFAEVLSAVDELRGKVSTVGIAATESKLPALATQLARWGVTRICPLGQMQNPPLAWRHDGRPALGDWVTWVDNEGEDGR